MDPLQLLDDQVKRIPNAEVRADTMAKRKALDNLSAIKKCQKVVREATARGKYKPKEKEQTSSSARNAISLPVPPSREAAAVTPPVVTTVQTEKGPWVFRQIKSSRDRDDDKDPSTASMQSNQTRRRRCEDEDFVIVSVEN